MVYRSTETFETAFSKTATFVFQKSGLGRVWYTLRLLVMCATLDHGVFYLLA